MNPPATLLLRPILPLWVILPALAAFAGLSWLTYRHCPVHPRMRWLLWGLRVAAMLLLAWLLLQGQWRATHTRVELPTLAVALDVSDSMHEKLGDNPRSRAECATAILDSSRFRALCSRYRTRFFQLGESATEWPQGPADPVFNAPHSNLSRGLNGIGRRLQAENVAALVVLTDGLDHAPEALTAEARALPMLVAILEGPVATPAQRPEEVQIGEVSYPRVAVLGWKAAVEVLVRRSNGRGEAAVKVNFLREGETVGSQTLAFAESDTFQRAVFEITPDKVGRHFCYVEIEPPGDADRENNMREFVLDVRDPQNSVLYIEGPPRWEFKFIKRAVQTEKTFKLAAYVRAADGAFLRFGEGEGAGMAAMPALTAEALEKHTVVILGDLPAAALPAGAAAALRSFVEKGGGLLFLGAANAYGEAGWAAEPAFRELLPAVSQPGARMVEGHSSVAVPPAGLTHPALRQWFDGRELPPVLSVWRPVEASPFATVLVATADNAPVLVTRPYGEGRVAIVLSDSLWRWQMGGGEAAGGKTVYDGFITQLLAWLAPDAATLAESALLQIVLADNEFDLREPVTIGALHGRRAEGGDGLRCEIETPDGRRLAEPMLPAELGAEVGLRKPAAGYACQFMPAEPGRYALTVTTADGTQTARERILVRRPERERTGAPVNRAWLETVAAQTGGRLVALGDADRLADWVAGEPRTLEVNEESPVWNRPEAYVLLVLLFLAEWFVRRRMDMV